MIPAVDFYWSAAHYSAHLRPVRDALPAELRGASDPRTGDPGNRVVVVAAHRDLLAMVRRGYTRIAYLEHGIGQPYGVRNPGYPGGARRDAIGLFLSPNETAAGLDRAAYPSARVVAVGDPRLDTLPAREPGPPTIALSFHWDCRVVPETRSAWRHYAPAFRDLAATFNVIGHAHPKIRAELAPVYRKAGIEFVDDFDEVCRRADVYACDNSSTLYEFASTGRAVVVLNDPRYRRDVEHGLRFWRAASVGRQVDGPGERLLEALEDALAAPGRDATARGYALELAYAEPFGAAQRAAAAIAEWIT